MQDVKLGAMLTTPYGLARVNEIHRVDDVLVRLTAKTDDGKTRRYTTDGGWEKDEKEKGG